MLAGGEVMKDQPKERGAARVIIDLTKGVITVRHGASPGEPVLAQWTANAGDWEKLWQTINQLKVAGDANNG
jgi:hypothetical protein